MPNFLLKLFTPQSARIYKLLIKNKPLNARQIGKKLNIYPNAVYRNVEELIQLGFVDKFYGYPLKYKAKFGLQVMDLCSSVLRENFQKTFGFRKFKRVDRNVSSQTFIATRQESFMHTDEDIYNAKSRINFMVLGSELPQETLLAHKRAIERGVKIRMLVRNLNQKNQEMFQNWQKMGIQVRHYPGMEARIFIFDQSIVYLASYNPQNIQEAMTARFNYRPYAELMEELFERRWAIAHEII